MASFADCLELVPQEWRDWLKAKSFDNPIVLANLSEDRKEELRSSPFPAIHNLLRRAEAIEYGAMYGYRNAPEQAPARPPPTPKEVFASLAKSVRKPLKFPAKLPSIRQVVATPAKGDGVVDPKVAKRQEAQQLVIKDLFSSFMELGRWGTLWARSCEQDAFADQTFKVVTDGWDDVPNLNSHLATLILWKEFCGQEGLWWQTPDSVAVRAFLTRFRASGKTVPKRHLDSIRWLESNLGLVPTSTLDRVKKCCSTLCVEDTAEQHQAVPARWVVLLALENMLEVNNDYVFAIAFFGVAIVTSVLRPKHLQRSEVDVNDGRIIGHCSKGKSREQGKQWPFWWAMPPFGLSGVDLRAAVARLLKVTGAATDQNKFLLPDLLPARTDWSSAKSFANVPMPLVKARRLISLLLKVRGVPPEAADALEGLYSFRRVFPMLAHVMEQSPEKRLELGGWVDSNAKSRLAMPIRYSDAKLLMQERTKTEVVVTAQHAVQQLVEAGGPEANMVDIRWETIFTHWPPKDSCQAAPFINFANEAKNPKRGDGGGSRQEYSRASCHESPQEEVQGAQ